MGFHAQAGSARLTEYDATSADGRTRPPGERLLPIGPGSRIQGPQPDACSHLRQPVPEAGVVSQVHAQVHNHRVVLDRVACTCSRFSQ